MEDLNQNIVIGRNSVLESLKNQRCIENIFILKGKKEGSILKIIAKAKESKIPIKEVDIKKLNSICNNENHQGIIAAVSAAKYSSIEEILELAKQKNQDPFIIITDGIEDPHNLGAILRTAECAGAHGVIVPKRNAVGLTSGVSKASAGAMEYIKVARVSNIVSTLKELKKQGIWVYCAEAEGTLWNNVDLKGPIALVIGSEGRGVSRLVKETCDGIVSLPMYGNINSLNASVACGILIYEVLRQRN